MELSKDLVKTSNVIGVEVKNKQGEDLGKIEEIILDKLSGETRYVVLSFGGILGLGDKLFALPWKSLSYSREKEAFEVNIPKERLKDAPGFNKDNWPDMAEPQWQQTISDYYGNIL